MREIKSLKPLIIFILNNHISAKLFTTCAEQEICEDTLEDCMLSDSLKPHLKPRMVNWSESVCKKGFENNLTKEYEKEWFGNCCRTCCEMTKQVENFPVGPIIGEFDDVPTNFTGSVSLETGKPHGKRVAINAVGEYIGGHLKFFNIFQFLQVLTKNPLPKTA